MAVIDCFGILNDEKIKRYFELGCEVKGLGRGYVKTHKRPGKSRKMRERGENMNSEDFNRLEQLFFKFSSEIKDDSRKFKDEIKEEFQHQLTVQREDFQKQLEFVGEGFQMLSEKIDRVETRLDKRMDCFEHKLDAVAADLSAHRADTEAHRPVYRVKE